MPKNITQAIVIEFIDRIHLKVWWRTFFWQVWVSWFNIHDAIWRWQNFCRWFWQFKFHETIQRSVIRVNLNRINCTKSFEIFSESNYLKAKRKKSVFIENYIKRGQNDFITSQKGIKFDFGVKYRVRMATFPLASVMLSCCIIFCRFAAGSSELILWSFSTVWLKILMSMNYY